jgi:putative oxidoreductase
VQNKPKRVPERYNQGVNMKYFGQLLAIVDAVQPKLTGLPPLVARITTGWIFLWSGWGKLHNLEDVTAFFMDLGIPAASVQAPAIATLELVGGAMLLLGLGTRFFSFMLSCTMVVAILTALREDLEGLGDLFALSEYLYITLFLYLIVQGAGMLSADAAVREWYRRQSPAPSA